jgi:hypothetical protein
MHHVALSEISQCISRVLLTSIILLPNTRRHVTFGAGWGGFLDKMPSYVWGQLLDKASSYIWGGLLDKMSSYV